MALIFPHTLVIIIRDEDENLITDSVEIVLTLFAREKNDYHIGAVSEDGKVVFEKEQVKKEIHDHWRSALMDYKSKLEECKEIVKIMISSDIEVRKAIEGYKLWKEALQIPQSKIDALQNAQNYKYEPKTLMVKLNDPKYAEEKTVVIKTKRKQ